MNDEETFAEELLGAIRAAQSRGAATFQRILTLCDGADPRLVDRILGGTPVQEPTGRAAAARRESSELSAGFPAPDPVSCQWWFTLETVERLTHRIAELAKPSARTAFLGTPTVGYQHSRRFEGATVFDVDLDVVTVLNAAEVQAVHYDVSNELPPDHVGKYNVVLLDPPWYPEEIRAFLKRAMELGEPCATILCSLPPRLTRPGIVRDRQTLLGELIRAGVEIVAVERSALEYLVPSFERAAYRDVAQFEGTPWRPGDLLHLRKSVECEKAGGIEDVAINRTNVVTFARRASKYRVFLRADSQGKADLRSWLEADPRFENTVSRRSLNPSELEWWTSERKGGRLRDLQQVSRALKHWAGEKPDDGLDRDSTKTVLEQEGMSADAARTLCDDLDSLMGLWSSYGHVRARNVPHLALNVGTGRPYKKIKNDSYRTDFQRDRDRVTWSRGLRQLANKTQVFSLGSGDFLRNRLAHSLEVSQLAVTIGESFGLNLSLIEAGALAHDIGHTPFGHAGEAALNSLFQSFKSNLMFNHYEHGVDVIRWLEDAYQSSVFGGIFGLNVTSEVAECIFKHTYCHSGQALCQREIYKFSKHQSYFSDDLCHLEGQAVRAADKISYLISDLEDGARMGVFSRDDFLRCRLLRRAPLNFDYSEGDGFYEDFLSQRGLLIGLIMEDVIDATAKRLLSIRSISDVRNRADYTVAHSSELQDEIDEVWEVLQSRKLHLDARVRIANLRAGRITKELTLLFSVAPQLVDERFRQGHERLVATEYMGFYRKIIGKSLRMNGVILDFILPEAGSALGLKGGVNPEVPAEDIVMAKDFVASLSDERACELHHAYLAR